MRSFRHITKGSFGYQVLTLASGTLAGQLILFFSLPLLQRYLYGPEAFGIFALYVSISELLIEVSGLKYEYGIVKQRNNQDAVNTLFLSLTCITISSLLTASIVSVLYVANAHIEFVQHLGGLMFLFPVSILFFGAANAFGYWFNRENKYRHISLGKVANSISSEPTKFGLSIPLNGLGAGLILGRVVGQMANMLYLLIVFFKNDRQYIKLISFRDIKKLARKLNEFPLYQLPSSLITIFITTFYFNFFMSEFGMETVGHIGVSVSYIGVAFGILSRSVGQVFYKRISETENVTDIAKLYTRFARLLLIPAFATVTLVYLIPSNWVTVLLGERWAQIMPVSRIMVLWMAIAFVSSSLSFIHVRLGTQKQLLFIDVFHLAMVALALYGSFHLYQNLYTSLYWFAGAQIIHYILVIFAGFYFLGIFNRRKEG